MPHAARSLLCVPIHIVRTRIPVLSQCRHGAALAELAIFLPVLFLITITTTETCRVIYLRQSVKIAAFETARVAVVSGATLDMLQAQTDNVLLGRKITAYSLVVTPSDFASVPRGELVTIRIDTSIADNSYLGSCVFRNHRISESVSIMKE